MEPNNLPPLERQEWRGILNGEIEYKFKNYSFQISVHMLKLQLKNNTVTLDDAASTLRQISQKYYNISIDDITEIFKEW